MIPEPWLEVLNPDNIPVRWLLLGFLAQAMFSFRFLFQWIVSERRRESVVPTLFWWFSIAGGVLLLTYALHRLDPVIVVGQAAGLIVYVRNLMLIRNKRSEARDLRAS